MLFLLQVFWKRKYHFQVNSGVVKLRTVDLTMWNCRVLTTDHIYHRVPKLRGDNFDRSMTRVQIPNKQMT